MHDWAIATVKNLHHWSKNTVKILHAWVKNTIITLHAWVKNTIIILHAWVKNTINTLHEWVKNTINILHNWVTNSSKGFHHWLVSSLKGIHAWGIKTIASFYHWLLNFPNHISLRLKYSFDHFLNVEQTVSPLREALTTQGLDGAINFLKKKYGFFKPAAVRFLISLYEYSKKQEALFANSQNHEKVFIIHFCCWGKSYANKAKNYLLPSLLADGNLPALSKQFKIIIYIHCDGITKEAIQNSEIGQQIGKYALLQTEELPKKIFKNYKAAVSYPNVWHLKNINRRNDQLKYLLLGCLQTLGLNKGLKMKSLVSFLMPDVVLSNSFFSIASSKIEEKKLVVSSTFRTDFFTVARDMAKFYQDNEKSTLSIPANEMVKMQIEHLHHHDKRRVISKKTRCFIPTPRMIFKAKNGLLLRAVQYHPILLDCSKIDNQIHSDYFPIDDLVLKYVLSDDIPYQEQVWLCPDASVINIMELSGDEPDILEMPYPKDFFYTYDELVHSLYNMLQSSSETLNNNMSRFFMRNEIKFLANKNYYNEDEVVDSHLFVKDVYNKLGYEII